MATTSRYAPAPSGTAGLQTQTGGVGAINQSTTGNQQSQTTGQSDTNQTGSSRTRENTTQQSNTQNMTGSSLAALEALIQQLLGGGTQDMAQQRAQRQGEVNQVQATRAGYTKEAAFNDAQGMIAQTMRQSLEKLLPGINRAAEGAGTSQSSMRALLTQQAQQQAAEAAATQGLNAAVQYGSINTNLSNVLNSLTQPDNTVTNALLQALQTARGAVTNTTTTGTRDSTTQSDQTSQTNSNQNTNTTSQQNQNQQRIGQAGTAGSTTPQMANVDGLVYYGPQTTSQGMASRATGSSLDTLLQLAGGSVGGGSGWDTGFEF